MVGQRPHGHGFPECAEHPGLDDRQAELGRPRAPVLAEPPHDREEALGELTLGRVRMSIPMTDDHHK